MSKIICHEHCPGGGGGVAVVVVLAVVLVAAGAVHAEAHAIERTVEEIVTIGAIALASAIVLAVAGFAGMKLARSQEFRTALADPVARERARIAQAEVPAIEAPRRNLAGEYGVYTVTDLAERRNQPWNGSSSGR